MAGGAGVEPGQAGALASLAAVFGGVVGAFGLWLANRMLGKAAFQTAINDGFAKLTGQLQEERDGLHRALDAERVQWAAERARLTGEIRNLMQTIESLKNALRRHGIDIPQLRAAEPEPGAVELGEDGAHGQPREP